ncbi:AAA family ATPase [Candidatus Nomurabacteria bacterium]|nr:AAA family ATPase [Candidatus Nomurabacteria bacterium]
MLLENQIIEVLKEGKPLRANEIASRIDGVTEREVASVLNRQLRTKIIQNSRYQWSLISNNSTLVANTNPEGFKKDTPLSKLSSYYLECISKDLDNGISEFASSLFGSPNYVQLPKLFDEQKVLNLDSDKISYLAQKLRRDRHGLSACIGYPVMLEEFISKAGKPFYKVMPILIQRIDSDSFLKGEIVPTDESPFINAEASKLNEGSSSNEVLQDIIQLNEELGLDFVDVPSIEDIALRLKDIRPNWKWINQVDPELLSQVDLSQTKTKGIYNTCGVFLAERSKYTLGLEKELTELSKMDETRYDDTILGKLINQKIGESKTVDRVLIEPLQMNEEQREAILKGLQNELTVVTGPPGTGKSQVVSNLVVNAVHQGYKILFASRNNKAVDVVLDRINGLSNKPVMLRLGNNEKQDELSQYLTGLISSKSSETDEINFKTANELHLALINQVENIQEKQKRLVDLRNQVDSLDQEIGILCESLGKDTFGKISNISGQDIANARTFSHHLESCIDQSKIENLNFIDKLLWPFTKGKRYNRLIDLLEHNRHVVKPLFLEMPRQFDVESIIEQSSSFFKLFNNHVLDIIKIQDYNEKLNRLQNGKSIFDLSLQENNIVEQISENSNKLWNLWLQLLPGRLSRDERKLIGDYITVLDLIIQSEKENQKTRKSVWVKYYDLLPRITNILSCWAVTSLSVRSKVPFEPGFFDLVIIDEASQCDIASAIPLLYRAKRAVIIGDDKQLTHITTISKSQDNQLLEKYELTQDHMVWSYASASLFRLSASLCGNNDIVQLKDHHRSHADIISYSNKYFYDGTLRVATNYNKLKSIPNEPPIRWIDIQGNVITPAGGGSLNEKEAKRVVEELRRLVGSGYKGSIGVVSPFRAQANKIKDIVFADNDLYDRLVNRDFLVDTVHKFQGDERDVMIFSSVVSSGISRGSEAFLSNTGNLFNVAITRARAALIIVGDQSACYNSSIKHFSQFAEHVKTINENRDIASQDKNMDCGPKFPPVSSADIVSEWEKILYEALYKNGIRTLPQYKVDKYSLDLALFENGEMLDIEVDGEAYHRNWDGELMRRDKIRNKRLIELGWDVKRFWVYEIREDLNTCVDKIAQWKRKMKEAEFH